MRSFPIEIKDGLSFGLRSSEKNSKNTQALVGCRNYRVGKEGLVALDKVIMPFYPITVSYPFPQLFRGKEITLLVFEDSIYEVDETSWAYTQLVTYDANSVTVAKDIVKGGTWHFADMGTAWVLFNGSCMVFRDGLYPTKVLVHSGVRLGTGAYFRGRLMTGGIVSGGIWDSTWQAYFELYKGKLPSELSSLTYDLRKNYVLWSSIGQADFSFRFLMYPDEAMEGLITDGGGVDPFDAVTSTTDTSRFMELMKKNDFGLAPVPHQGRVLKMMPIKGEKDGETPAMICYSEDGITALIPHTDPVPTFGFRVLGNFGIPSRSAVGGNDDQHFIIDTSGCAWRLDGNLTLNPLDGKSRLDYREYFREMLSSEILVNYDGEEGNFYISNNEYGYLYSRDSGLSEVNQLVTSCAFVDGGTIGVFSNNGKSGTEVITDTFDFELTGLKTLTGVEVGTSKVEKLRVAVEFKLEGDTEFRRTNFVRANNLGQVSIKVQAKDFRVVIQNSDEGNNINYIKVWVQVDDKRMIRGTFGAASNQRTGR